MTRKNNVKQLAEEIIKGAVDDIRWPDVLMRAKDHEQAQELLELIEAAKITVRWSR